MSHPPDKMARFARQNGSLHDLKSWREKSSDWKQAACETGE
jgi:hypothetical protein